MKYAVDRPFADLEAAAWSMFSNSYAIGEMSNNAVSAFFATAFV